MAARLGRHAIAAAVAAVCLAAWYASSVAAGFFGTAASAGRIVAGGVRAPVTIARDARAIAHITAASQDDAFFAQGFAEGSDRLFQLDLTRRYAYGRLAEIFGQRALALDESLRTEDVADIVARQWRRLDPSTKLVLERFSAGVNTAIATQPLPVEFALLQYRPAAWKPQDSLAVSVVVSLALADSWRDVLARDAIWREGGASAFDRTFPLGDRGYDVSTGGLVQRPGSREVAAAAAPVLPRVALARLARPRVGSNAWAAGGARTRNGRALLANDPHLDLTIPGLWYLVDLQAPGLHVAGAAIPGVPGVALGHNERIAWAATNADAAAMSLFSAGRFARAGWVRERFGVRFHGEVVRAYYRTSREFAVENPYRGNAAVLVRWAQYAQPESSIPTFLALDRSRDAGAALRALSAYRGTAENFMLAGSDGTIAYHLAGSVPNDPAWGRYVHPAGDMVRTYPAIAFGALPSLPPSRTTLAINANNRMYGPEYRYRLAPDFEPPYRAFRIAQLLHRGTRYDAEWFARMQLDVVSPVDAEVAHRLAKRYAGDPQLRGVVRLLAGWNGAFDGNSIAAGIEASVRARAQTGVTSFAQLLWQLRSGNVPEVEDAQLRDALTLAPMLPWRRAGAVPVEHPLARLRFGFLDGTTLPGDGDAYTVHLQETGFAQSFRAVWEPGDWNAGGIVIPSGESGEPGSPHYDDLRAAWISGTLVPLPFGAHAMRAATRQTLVLTPIPHR